MTLDELQTKTREIRQLLEKCWSEDTRAPQGDYYSHQPPSAGQCAVTALLVQDILGGHLLSGRVNYQSHWYNWVPAVYSEASADLPFLSVVDLTADQFMCDPIQYGGTMDSKLNPYPRIRDRNELQPETLARYELLKSRLKELHG